MTTSSTPTPPDSPTDNADRVTSPAHRWAPPAADAHAPPRTPRLSRLLLLLPLAALISGYAAAAAAAHGHVQPARWLVVLAAAAIVLGAVMLAVHAHRLARHRRESPG